MKVLLTAPEKSSYCEPDPRDIEKLVQEVYEEAEVIPHEEEINKAVTQALIRMPHETGLATVAELEQQFALAVRQRELLSDYIKKHLIPGKHFYEIQGNKPSLTKEGAEIILLPHNLAPDYEIVSGPHAPLESDAPYQITVKCTLRRKGDPQSFVGSAIGSAGSHKRDKHGNYNPRQTDKYLCHNATLKMAEKSAMIAATLNSTAGSEFFTQDMDDAPVSAPEPPRRAEAPRPPYRPIPVKPPAPPPPRIATDTTRAWMAQKLEPCMQEALRYFIEAGVILPNETIDDVPLRYVPVSKVELIKLVADITHFAISGRLEGKPIDHSVEHPVPRRATTSDIVPQNVPLLSLTVDSKVEEFMDEIQSLPMRQAAQVIRQILSGVPFGVHEGVAGKSPAYAGPISEGEMQSASTKLGESREARETALQILRQLKQPDAPPGLRQAVRSGLGVSGVSPEDSPDGNGVRGGSGDIRDYDLAQWPFTCIIPIPRKGMKRDDYLKNPDTIGSLFELRHGTDEESAAARQRLWGFIHHFESKTWVDRQGQTRMPSKADVDFRKALDLLADMLEKKGDKI